MKFMLRGEVQLEIPVFGAACGVGCDSIQLDVRDVLNIANIIETDIGARKMADWWSQVIACRFVAYPGDAAQIA